MNDSGPKPDLLRCPACGAPISEFARACPKCGNPANWLYRMTWKYFAAGFILLLALAWMIGKIAMALR